MYSIPKKTTLATLTLLLSLGAARHMQGMFGDNFDGEKALLGNLKPQDKALFEAVASGPDDSSPFSSAEEILTKGLEKIQQALEKPGVNVNAQDKKGQTPLHRACGRGAAKIVETLLKYGKNININAMDKNGQTPLHSTIDNFLADVDAGKTIEIIDMLLKKGANINAPEGEDKLAPPFSSGGYRTPLHLACEKGYFNIAKYLINRGAKIEAHDGNDKTPLQRACKEGHSEIANLLVAHGANTRGIDAQCLDNIPARCKKMGIFYTEPQKFKNLITFLAKNNLKPDLEKLFETAKKYGCKEQVQLLREVGLLD